MLIGSKSQYYKKLTSANAKMEEYDVAKEDRIIIEEPIEKVFLTAIGVIGEVSANIQRNNDRIDEILETSRSELLFSAKYIEDYYNGNINKKNESLYLIISAVGYYLANNIGNSKVLIKKIEKETLDLNLNGLDYAIVSLLRDDFDISNELKYQGKYQPYLLSIKAAMKKFLKGILVIICMIISVPITIGLLAALFGFGSLIMIMPEIMGGILVILAIFAIPGLIVGLIIGNSDKK